jgi:hypothetical protein
MTTNTINGDLNISTKTGLEEGAGMSIGNILNNNSENKIQSLSMADTKTNTISFTTDGERKAQNENENKNVFNEEKPVTPPPIDILNEENSANKRNMKVLLPLIAVLILLILGVFLTWRNVTKPIGNVLSPLPGADDNGTGSDTNGIGNSSNKTYENPLNGMRYTEEEAAKFKERKPVAVMVNNYDIARPSAGLSMADVVYEAVAEGGITRIMPIFYSRIPEKVSSVRSARYYFVQLASGYKAHYFHWGAAHVPPCQKQPIGSPSYCAPVNGKVETEPDVDAYDWIVKLGVPNLDGGNYECADSGCAFSRDPEKLGKVPSEHTAFVRLPEALELAKKIRTQDSWHKYIPVTKWEFKDDAKPEERGEVGAETSITYNYWDLPAFAVKWEYDKSNNEYIRYQGGVKQTDALTKQEIRAKDIIIRYTEQESVGDKKNHLYHELKGSGDALIFRDGKAEKAKWTRLTEDENDTYTTLEGEPFVFTRGQIWVQLLPIGATVNYESKVSGNSEIPVASTSP